MREIKFRALGVDGKWWFGESNPTGENHINLATFFANLHVGALRPETLGEWTGLHDKNGKEIWEGDILQADDFTGPVEWLDSGFKFIGNGYPYDIWKHCNVIGNIYENPELAPLEGKEIEE